MAAVQCQRTWRALSKRLTEKHFKSAVGEFNKVFARLDVNEDGEIDAHELRRLMFGDFMVPGADPKIYAELDDFDQVVDVVSEYLSDFN